MSRRVRGKVELSIYIPVELYETLTIMAVKRYGRIRGSLSKLVEELLRKALALETRENKGG